MGIVAKYKFDGSVYTDLIPEFNAEFSDYTITDVGNIIKNISWLSGYQISIYTGEYYENPNCHSSDFINVYFQGLMCASNQPVDVFWYDENKNYIGGLLWDNNTLENNPSTLMKCPENARYVKLSQYANRSDLIVTAGEIIRTIESDSLPRLMRFGVNEVIVKGRADSLLSILDINVTNLNTCYRMFNICHNLTYVNPSIYWDLKNVSTVSGMFLGCHSLKTLDLSKFDLNPVSMSYMFQNCNALEEINLGSIKFNNVTGASRCFGYLTKLKRIDLSNAVFKNLTSTDGMFTNLPLLKDIGMIYCDQSTINKVASLLPTDHNITIWVGEDDILQYDQYDHITYKTQKVQDTVHLNSPLLKGDTIEVIDGKT